MRGQALEQARKEMRHLKNDIHNKNYEIEQLQQLIESERQRFEDEEKVLYKNIEYLGMEMEKQKVLAAAHKRELDQQRSAINGKDKHYKEEVSQIHQ